MEYKAIFFDYDGTLSSFETHMVPPGALEAIGLAQQRGIKVFLATGRHPLSFMRNPQLAAIPFDAYLTTNGQYCYNRREVIHRMFLDPRDIQALFSRLEREPLPVMFLREEELCVNFVDRRVAAANAVLQSMDVPVKPLRQCAGQEIMTLLLYAGKEEEDALLQIMPHAKAVRWHHTFTDVIPAEGGKDVGIDAMLQYYGIRLEETMAFGDAQNDLDMLRHVGLGIAMGNASDHVKEAADYVTDSVDEDGVYNALTHFQVI